MFVGKEEGPSFCLKDVLDTAPRSRYGCFPRVFFEEVWRDLREMLIMVGLDFKDVEAV